MRRYTSYLLAVVVILAGSAGIAKENKLPLGFVLEPIVTGLDSPSGMAMTPDGRIYIAERTSGDVHLVLDGWLLPSPALSLSVASGSDRGLLDVAYHPGGPEGGYLFVYYTEPGGNNVVYRYTLSGNTAIDPYLIVNLGSSSGGTRLGGGLSVGNDRYLYISVGDMEVSSNAQNDGNNLGKILRLTTQGTIPPGQATAVYAKGFGDGLGLGHHPDVATVYQTDRGPSGEYDELNAVAQDGNYGWDLGSGPFGGGYDDPINYHEPRVDPRGLATYTGTHLPDASADGTDSDLDGTIDERDETYADSVFYACSGTNDIVRSVLIGADLDGQDSAHNFFDYSVEWDYAQDTDCPGAWTDLEEGADGMLYALSEGSPGDKDGLYRIVYDSPGPREVSPPGSPIPLFLEKDGSDLHLYWENVGRDAWVGTVRGATQPAEMYSIWEGTLSFTEPDPYTHTVHTTTDGYLIAGHEGLLTDQITPSSANRYYLVSAQGANREGELGHSRPMLPVSKTVEYCNEIGWYDNDFSDPSSETACDDIDNDGDGSVDERCPGRCGPDFVDGHGNPARLLDQYGRYWTMHDFRGDVIHLDISALNCYYCTKEAAVYSKLYNEYKGRGFTTITALMNTYQSHDGIAPEDCASDIQYWIDTYCPGTDKRVLCALDEDSDGTADIYEQYGDHIKTDDTTCRGTPQNLYFDQGLVMYDAVCGKYRGDCQLWRCDGDDAACNNDDDCIGHGGSEICDKSVVNVGTCYLQSSIPCINDDPCALWCVYGCHDDASCAFGNARVCYHLYDRAKVEEKLYPEYCE